MSDVLLPMLTEMAGLNGHTSDPELRDRTARIILPNDDFVVARNYLYGTFDAKLGRWKAPNTCALQALAALRAYYGISGYHETDKKYIPYYDAVTRVEELGKKLGVLDIIKSATGTELPVPGDFVLSGDFPVEHISCVVDYAAATGEFLTCDGGQGVGSETIVVRRKIILDGDTYTWSSPFGVKPIRRILRMERL